MTVCIRMAFGISAVVLLFGLMLAPAAIAQDAMQLDIDFKNSLSQQPRYEQRHDFQQRQKERQRAGKAIRREKGQPVEAIAQR